jgi:hypothetical protein
MAAWLGSALALASLALAQDANPDAAHAPQDEYEFELPPADKSDIEQMTCRAWHDRALGLVRASQQYDHKHSLLSLECDSHARLRKFPLHALGICSRTEGDWECRKNGLSIELKFGRDAYWVGFGEIPPQTAYEIVKFVRRAKWDHKPVGKELAGTMTLHDIESRPDEFWLEIEYDTDHDMDIVVIPVSRECRGNRCRYRVTGVNHTRTVFSN